MNNSDQQLPDPAEFDSSDHSTSPLLPYAPQPATELPYGWLPTSGSGLPGHMTTGDDEPAAAGGSTIPSHHRRSYSPSLAVCGALTLAVACWALVGEPTPDATFWQWTGIVVAVLLGLVLVLGSLRGRGDDG